MTTKQLKNNTSYGCEMKKMNDNTYALRRKVIDVIYKLKKHIDLPRIEVRIVDKGESNIGGYAYLNKNIIHIREEALKFHDSYLLWLVCHEVVHAVVGYDHNDNCYLMSTYAPLSYDDKKTIEVFKSYFKVAI